MRENILREAQKFFFKNGLRSATMDDLCKSLGISKKTLYRHFSNKEALVREVMQTFMKKNTRMIAEMITGAPHAIAGFFETSSHVYQIMNRISPVLIFEIRKYYPSIWHELQSFKRSSIESMATENLKRGVEEGLYRSDIDIDMVMRFYLAILLNMNDEELFPETLNNPAKIYEAFINYHLRSIATPEGYRLFTELIEGETIDHQPYTLKQL